jgi:multidrug efflux pump subunit AcrB
LAVYGGLVWLTYWGFTKTPVGFIPQQDKGYLLVNVQLPDSASLERTDSVMRQVEKVAKANAGVRHTVAIAGQSVLLNANAPNFGSMFVMLDEFHQRLEPGLSADEIAAGLRVDLQDAIGEGLVQVFGAPPVEGLGTAGGFKIVIEDRGDSGPKALQDVADQVVDRGTGVRGLQGLYTSFRADTPWLFLKIDRIAAKMAGLSIAEIFNTLQVDIGSLYINDFNRFGRTWQVNIQASDKFRKGTRELKQLRVRSDRSSMVPLGTVASVEERSGPVMIVRYNMYPAAVINGNPAPGVSSGDAIKLMEQTTRQELDLNPATGLDWTELAFLQLQTGNAAVWAFALAVVLVFLVLAAQYESWSLPLAVILVVPMCLLCAIAGVVMARMDVNIFTQVGFIVLVGLACKNAILIVEYAKTQHENGVPRFQATLEACRLRLRPIIMTSFAFILGVVPLMLAEGAGAEMRRTLGVAVFSGMLGVTLFGIFLTPVFYYVIQWFTDWRSGKKAPSVAEPSGNGHAWP